MGAGKKQYQLLINYILRLVIVLRIKITQSHIQHHSITVTSQCVLRHLKLPASRSFAQPFVQAQIKENIKSRLHWPLWGEFTSDWWIPHRKGQWRGKCFHLMTSSWLERIHMIIKPLQNTCSQAREIPRLILVNDSFLNYQMYGKRLRYGWLWIE